MIILLKAESLKKEVETTLTNKFNNIQKQLKNNNGGQGYMVGDKVSMGYNGAKQLC